MFSNNLKIAWRNLWKDRQFTFLNLLGLATGLACTLLIYFWVQDELSFDKFFDHDERLYEVMENRNTQGITGVSDESCGALSEAIKNEMPEVEYASPLAPPAWFPKYTLQAEEKAIKATGQYAGKDYFNVFSFHLLDGEKNQVLADKKNIVISETLAKRLFNRTNNLTGKKIRFQNETDFFISGVFQDLPLHSSQQFDFVLSFDYLKDVQPWVVNWNATGPHNFVLLKPGTDAKAFNRKIAGIVTRNSGDTGRSAFVMPFSSIYLNVSFDHGVRVGGKIEYVRLFSLIAGFILVIACINFMNLSTAKASRRLKEVGIKKVVGAGRAQLIFQFLSESIMITLVAVVLAMALAWSLLPQFNELTGKQILLKPNAQLIWGTVIIAVITGVLSGSYPALYLSSFNPLAILKGKLRTSFAEVIARKGLVVFQFTLSVILIVAVVVVYRQIQFIQHTSPGYNKDNVLRFSSEGRMLGKEDEFAALLKSVPGVVNASYTFNNMVGRNYGTTGLYWEGKPPNTDIYFEGFGSGYDFTETMGMEMKEGRSFSRAFGGDTAKIILNETAVTTMNLKNPVGKIVRLYNRPFEVIGIVKNFHFESLHQPVKPTFMTLTTTSSWLKMMVRIRGGQEKETIARIKDLYNQYNPGFQFDPNFLDEAYQQQYDDESRVTVLSRYFAGLAIIISCLGLFGLAAFTAQKRQKEIGIRKVIGASTGSITTMLSKDFLKLILISILIAFPVSWWAMTEWLRGYAYRVNINAGVFLLAGGSVILITLLTVSFQAIRAALANPVTSLRSE